MFNISDAPSHFILQKDLITDRSYKHISKKSNFENIGLDPENGIGAKNISDTIVLINAGGFKDQRITAELKYISPTIQGEEDIGVMLRMLSCDPPDSNYYCAKVSSGTVKIVKVVNDIPTILATAPFILSPNFFITIIFSVVGNYLEAFFNSSKNSIKLGALDSDIPQGGLFAFGSKKSTIYCKRFIVEQL
ncbi:MAG: hypothetical protein FK734_10655 [Asgard group archaeon]|nr:hypothetical protein [Asgard group archaeon]